MSIKKSPPAAATRVPPEILLDILHLADRKTLRSAALTHPSWTRPSKFLLEADLSLPSRKIAKSWLQVENRKCWSRKLSLPIGLDTEDCWEVLEGVEGLEHLTLIAQEGASGKSKFEIELLEASSLRGLRSLRLTAPFSEPIYPSIRFTFPFQLSILSFKGLYSSYPPALLESLVSSSSDTMTSLSLDVYGSQAAASDFFESLLPIASRLHHVQIHGSDRSCPALLAFLTGCTSLQSFTCWEATPAILSTLSPTCHSLEIQKNFVFHSDLLYDTLLTGSGILDQLRRIKWAGISRASLKAQRGGCELLDECDERGIETQFGVESHGNWYGLGVRTRRG